mgnify:CR=1 FL=1
MGRFFVTSALLADRVLDPSPWRIPVVGYRCADVKSLGLLILPLRTCSIGSTLLPVALLGRVGLSNESRGINC